jgi:hypothetical protein
MSDTSFDYDDDQDDQQPEAPSGGKGLRQALERTNAEAAAAKARADAAERKLAFLEAKVDLSTPIGKLFAKSYDGELDPAAIASEYAALVPNGSAPTPAPDATPVVDPAIAAQTAAHRLSVGETNPAPVNKTPRELAMEARANSGSREEAVGAWMAAALGNRQ